MLGRRETVACLPFGSIATQRTPGSSCSMRAATLPLCDSHTVRSGLALSIGAAFIPNPPAEGSRVAPTYWLFGLNTNVGHHDALTLRSSRIGKVRDLPVAKSQIAGWPTRDRRKAGGRSPTF